MNPQDLFLKISIEAYYPLEGKSISQKTAKYGSDEVVEYYIDGKKVDPDIRLYPDNENDLLEDSYSIGIELVNRDKVWKDNPDFKLMDELIMKNNLVK